MAFYIKEMEKYPKKKHINILALKYSNIHINWDK